MCRCKYNSKITQTDPQALTIQKQKGKSKHNLTEGMPIVVAGNANQLWEQMPSPPKTRPPYVTWTWVKPEKQMQGKIDHGISILFT